MGLESGTYIDDLNPAWPLGGDQISFGPHHIRLIKTTVQNTFPNITGPVTLTQAQINGVAIKNVANVFTHQTSFVAMTAGVQLESGIPGLMFKQTNAILDEKYWVIYASSNRLRFTAVSDDGATSTEFITVFRSGGGAVPFQITFNLPAAAFAGGVSATHYEVGSGDTTLARSRAGHFSMEGVDVGYLEVPQNSKSVNYTCVLEDSGKHIFHPSAGGAGDTFTIPSNASIPYPLGTVITFINRSASALAIAIASDTMTLAGTALTGPRSLAQNGIASAIKDTTTGWLISGTGLT